MSSVRESLQQAVDRAKQAEEAGDAQQAAAAYRSAASFMRIFASQSLSRDSQLRRSEKACGYEERAKQLEQGQIRLAGSVDVDPAAAALPENHRRWVDTLRYSARVSWDDIGGLGEVKRNLLLAYGLALAKQPEKARISSGWRNVLLYGPPGTGKTLLAAATSSQLNAAFYNVKTSSLLSKYFGESPRLISALFEVARSEADASFVVIFIDEFDALSQRRGEGSESGAERRLVSTILAEMDGLAEKGENAGVLTMAATNAPWDLDDAVLSRFQSRILIPLPDEEARRAIIGLELRSRGVGWEADLHRLTARTEYYSGRDLGRLCTEVVQNVLREMNPSIPDLVLQGPERIRDYELRIRPLTDRDFDKGLETIRIDREHLRQTARRYEQFVESS